MPRGRKKGYTHSPETKKKIGEGNRRILVHKEKGPQSLEHKAAKAATKRATSLSKKLKGEVKAGNLRKKK